MGQRLIDASLISEDDFYDCVDCSECMEVVNAQPTVEAIPIKLLSEALALLKASEHEAWVRCDCNYCATIGCARHSGTMRKCLAGDGNWKWQYADHYEKLKVVAERTNKNESN